MRSGTPSSIRRCTVSPRRSSCSPSALRARNHSWPCSSRLGKAISSPSSRRVTCAVSPGTARRSGSFDHTKRPSTRCSPDSRCTPGRCSETGTTAESTPSTRTSSGHSPAPPGSTKYARRSNCTRCSKRPPLASRLRSRRPGQRQRAFCFRYAHGWSTASCSTHGTQGCRGSGTATGRLGCAPAMATDETSPTSANMPTLVMVPPFKGAALSAPTR